MLYAIRSNKHLKITESERAAYLDMGYDIAEISEEGEQTIIEVAPSKTVLWTEYQKALDQIAVLKEEVVQWQWRQRDEKDRAIVALEKENAELKKQLAEKEELKGKGGK